jgi:hypothetical protein
MAASTALVGRNFMEVSRSRIEGLLAAFPKLIDTEGQHTFVETDTVRWVGLFVLVVATPSSSFLRDDDHPSSCYVYLAPYHPLARSRKCVNALSAADAVSLARSHRTHHINHSIWIIASVAFLCVPFAACSLVFLQLCVEPGTCTSRWRTSTWC